MLVCGHGAELSRVHTGGHRSGIGGAGCAASFLNPQMVYNGRSRGGSPYSRPMKELVRFLGYTGATVAIILFVIFMARFDNESGTF